MQKKANKIINAWCMYDWAASVYSLVITSSIFPIYYSNMAVNEQGGDVVRFFNWDIRNSVLFSYSLTFIFLFVAIINPLLTSIADYSGRKKLFMQFFCWLGGLACCSLAFFEKGMATYAILMFVIAGIGYSGSWVFYNSFLPEITTSDRFDSVSAKGYAFGYVGSVILLIFNLLMIMMPELFWNISKTLASQLSFLSVGIWWIVFAQYTFYHLPKDSTSEKTNHNWIMNGFKELQKVWVQIKDLQSLKWFLLSFFMYNMGVQTTMYVATIFAEKELHLPSSNLIATVLILQLIAIPGAMLFSYISSKFGNIKAIIVQLFVWCGICIGAYYVRNGIDFYVLATVVGMVMGGIQSLSRATYAKLIPTHTHDHASFFSFYEVTYNLSIVFGTFFYGFTEQLTGSARNSVLVLGAFFMLSIVLIWRLQKTKQLQATD
ncbi:MAG: MFS transporter [Bacteroidota bacterium]|nr:MFS transporter [Bacteroidota bacterium]